ncbi:MAG: TylF/MycF/NovP-related O-methyltransferase [Candidatus Brocadiia bacterium]
MIDPMLRNTALRTKLKRDTYGESAWIPFVLKHIIDPTILPPPSYTRERADAVYGQAFRRCVEFSVRSNLTGDVMEFGTLLGYTARWLAGLIREYGSSVSLWLYDSFEGLPDIQAEEDLTSYDVQVNKTWFKGAMKVYPEIHSRVQEALGRIIPPDSLHVIKGYFEQTLGANLPEGKATIIHVDSDLYASAKFVLETLLRAEKFQDGTILIFDDFNSNRANPRMGERLALLEAFASQTRFTVSPWFSYGWNGQTFFVHDGGPDA